MTWEETNRKVRSLLEAADLLNAGAEALAAGLGLGAGACVDLHERADKALRLAHRTALESPDWDDFADEFESRGL